MPELREVRQNAREVIHRSTDTVGHRHTVCGEELVHLAAEPRRWRGTTERELRECPVCFAPEATDDEIKPGDLVTLQPSVGIPSNPRGWTPSQVYVYVGESALGGNRSTVLVEDGWYVVENPERMPTASVEARLATPQMRAWNVRTDVLRHAPADTDADLLPPRIRRARNRLLALRTEVVPNSGQVTAQDRNVQLCTITQHPDEDHTHTTDRDPLWGNPRGVDGGNRMRHEDGTYVLFAKGAHAPTTTTESETQPVPPEQPAHEYPVGTDIYPITNQHIRALGPGSVVTVVSSNRGVEHGDLIQFGCKNFTHMSLRQANATVKYGPAGIICEADITLDGVQDYLTMAGQRISLGELRDYATSVIVKEIVERPAENALVMEHGFYGCAVHDNEVIFVGNGHPRGRTAVAPIVGKLHPMTEDRNRITGTVGQAAGLRQVTFADCTPVPGAATASTMHLVQARSWALVPATDQQISRVRAMPPGRRFGIGRTADEVVTACNMDGVPSQAPAMADATF